ncbi:DUF4180 domain-containing protein [Ruminococcaceae bacterium OttesenSCG-928-A16]|nr:DUF4180 domain-containing protein [Ruminococcaceae bacterium OttesenSCG-928-A16]
MITTLPQNPAIALVQSNVPVLVDAQSALDLMATIQHEYHCNKFIIYKQAIAEEFFDLSTCIAGEVLQKYTNYHIKMAIVGDFSTYTSKSLKDFIYESNKGNSFYFVATQAEAQQKLEAAQE